MQSASSLNPQATVRTGRKIFLAEIGAGVKTLFERPETVTDFQKKVTES